MAAMASAVSIETGVSLCFCVKRACTPTEPHKILRKKTDKICKHVEGIWHFVVFDLKNKEHHCRNVWSGDQ